MSLIETGIIKNMVRQDNPNPHELEKAFQQRIKKHMKKHHDDYFSLKQIERTSTQFLFEIHDTQGRWIHKYRMVLQNPNFHYKNHMGMIVQMCGTPFELFMEEN
jgi:hypothetical protein